MEQHDLAFELRAPAAEAMKLVGQFDLVADLSPQIAACVVEGDGVGSRRTLTMSDGSMVTERLVEEGPEGYAYELAEGPSGIEGYRIEIRVEPLGDDGCRVHWRLRLRMAEGRDPSPTVEALRGIAEVGFESARRLLERA